MGERLARFGHAFGGRVSTVALCVRSPEWYWASALGYGVARGRGVPGPRALDRLVTGPRGWREVVADIACALPGARLIVLPFERFAGRPEAQLVQIAGQEGPREHARCWLNATPRLPELRRITAEAGSGALPPGEGRWQPFEPGQRAALRARYADDLMWLASGAEGLATLAHDRPEAGAHPPMTDLTRGYRHEQDRRLAGAG